ncbi:MAG TPA: hypothetical protein VD962_06415 [Rubricoccaceae bacterium]|nr:hypothetical protein [Rubricoccaceae bacterium]
MRLFAAGLLALRFALPLGVLAGCASSRLPANPAASPAPAITDAPALIRAMHGRYAGRWYRTLAFTQATSRVLPDSTVRTETWREWMALPGRLRIEIGVAADGHGVLFARDSTFVVRGSEVVRAEPERNPLLLLGFDVYGQPPETTLRMLEEDGFDLSTFRTDTWEGRPAYVFGTPATKEVWVDAERLVFVRLLEPAGPGQIQDVRFADYEPLDGGWIAPTVEVWLGGRKVFWEAYSEIRTGFEADPVLFDPRRWGAALGVAR